jgi:F-type H+-transporting ATPase subunit delta
VTLRGRVDPAIIGGVVARVGDQLIDDSVRGRLARLRRTLAG